MKDDISKRQDKTTIKCDRCFHSNVCEFFQNHEICGYFCDRETTVTLPVFDADSRDKVKTMQLKGYSFVNTELYKQLIADSGELAVYKAKNFVPKKR